METIRDIGSRYEIVLLDNSVMVSRLDKASFNLRDPRIIRQLRERLKFLTPLKSYLIDEDAPLYMSPGIFQEFSRIARNLQKN